MCWMMFCGLYWILHRVHLKEMSSTMIARPRHLESNSRLFIIAYYVEGFT